MHCALSHNNCQSVPCESCTSSRNDASASNLMAAQRVITVHGRRITRAATEIKFESEKRVMAAILDDFT